jgi:nucleoid DNA-binding protein
MPRVSMEKLAREVSARAEYVDHETVKSVYRGLCRFIVSELRESGCVFLPRWGSFRLAVRKPGKVSLIDKSTYERRPVYLDSIQVLKFTPCGELKAYVRNMPRVAGRKRSGA